MRNFRFRPVLALCAIAATLALTAVEADARVGGSFGSRGSRTFSAPPPTATAPRATAPINRTMTQPGAATRPSPQTAPTGGFFGRPGLFGGGMFGGLLAGFLGAGLIGMLFGGGFMSGLGGFASFLGLLLQIGLVVIVARLVWAWWQRRNQPAHAYAGGPAMRDVSPASSRPMLGGLGGLGGASAAATTTAADFDTFERLLGEVQTAYGEEDLGKLRARLTPEMLSYFAEELAANASRGVVNKISDVKLLQGDLAEAWREGDTEYASVAMRYALHDQVVDRASGRVVEGGADEATEVWTFMRVRGGSWLLSAIQQT
jgi:predicted lipid-binding transport protein (Tim44 family)